jgi:osmotically-inducible protein OsmY
VGRRCTGEPIQYPFIDEQIRSLVDCDRPLFRHQETHGNQAKAEDVAKTAANTRIIANEISVQPVGSESQAKDVASNLDDGIEKDYKAALISSGLDKQHVRFNAKNGVLTLTGSVHNANERQHAEKLAAGIPNVQQVLNQIEVRR